MPGAKWTGLSDNEIAAELERKQVAMQQSKGTARRIAWYATFLCGLTIVAMLVLAWINRDTLPMPWLPFALIPFLSFLPVVFFRLAREQDQIQNQIRELRDRVEVLEQVSTGQRSGPG